MNITIIGQGKLGRSISSMLSHKGIKHTLYGRERQYLLTGLVYICVPESQIKMVSDAIIGDAIVLHSSGSLGLEVLHKHTCCGSLHPIMTFPGPEISLPSGAIPATFSGSEEAYPSVLSFAEQLGFTLYPYHGSRELYHSAAVISGNFATILLHGAASILESQGVPYQDALQMLHPLTMQSLQNAANGSLDQVLTGPLSRKETEIISAQITALMRENPALAQLYQSFIDVHRTFLINST